MATIRRKDSRVWLLTYGTADGFSFLEKKSLKEWKLSMEERNSLVSRLYFFMNGRIFDLLDDRLILHPYQRENHVRLTEAQSKILPSGLP